MADQPNADPAAAPAAADLPAVKTPAAAPAAAPAEPAGVTALIVCDGKVPAGDKRLIVVAEVRGDDGSPVVVTYDAGGAYYVRTTETLDMGCPPERLMTLGQNLQQFAFSGFSPSMEAVNVGPAHPAYAAANFAYNLGAKTIEVHGLSDAWKARFKPFLDKISPDFEANVSLT